MSTDQKGRTLKFHILKYDPQDPADEPKTATFEVEEATPNT